MSEVLATLSSLTDHQLLEIIVGACARRFETLRELSRASPEELERAGRSPRDAELLVAAFEIGRRACAVPRIRGDPISKAQDVLARYGPLLRDEPRERVLALLLDAGKRLQREVTVSIGTVDSSLLIPRDALAEAVRTGAAGVVFVHNHPSGNPFPSPEDVLATRRLRAACALLGIEFVDHVIVGGDEGFSFVEEGMT